MLFRSMLERCRPLHAFDLDRLAGRGLIVRTATAGERMTTLDGVERELAPEDLLICDAERRPQGIAGIMGGAEAEVGDATTSILLESAYFTPEGISRTSKRLGLRSESSARFERGIDPNAVRAGSDRAVELLIEHAAARVLTEVVDACLHMLANPDCTIEDLMKIVPESEWILFSHRIIHHGRRVCKARKPACDGCRLAEVCPQVGVSVSS